ncbi:MAG: hypothetical protein ACR2GN_00710 [Bacteroidia bacterium]
MLTKKTSLFLLILMYSFIAGAQEMHIHNDQPSIFYPVPYEEKKWQYSIGLTLITTPHEITEEAQYHLPAGDFHFTGRAYKKLYLEGRVKFQVFQNHLSLGPRLVFQLSEKTSLAIADEQAFWFGWLNIEGFNTRAYGFLNYPSISIGYQSSRDFLVTLKSELLINQYFISFAGRSEVVSDRNLLSGYAFGLILEQPFFKDKHLAVGFRTIYTDFHWQTWVLQPTFERLIFYPEIIVGFIL